MDILRQRVPFFFNHCSAYYDIVNGTSPLLLPKAKANSLRYVKAFGGTEQRNLPSEYTQLEYIESDGNQMIDLGLKWTYTIGTEVECEQLAYGSLAIGPIGVKSGGGGIWGDFVASNYTHYACFGNKTDKTYTMPMVDGQFHTWAINNAEASIDGVVKTTDIAGSNSSLVSTDNIGLFGRYDGSGNIERCGKWRVKYAKIYNSGLLIHHFVPASRKSDTVLGMYDLVSGNFLTNAGTGSFTAGPTVVPTPDAPMDIVSNNGVLKLSPNLFNASTETVGKYINDSGVIVSNANYAYSDFIPVVAGKTYTASLHKVSGAPAGTLRIHTYDSDGVWQQMVFGSTAAESGTITIPAGISYVRLSWWKAEYATDRQFEQGPTVTPYIPYGQIYTDGTVETIKDSLNNTATAEMLLKVGDYQDVQSVLDGEVTRQLGIKVLNGTESYVKRSDYAINYAGLMDRAYGATIYGMCSHFVCSANNASTASVGRLFFNTANNYLHFFTEYGGDVTSFKSWLTAQYNAGTPVIIVYPLANATTETVTPQALQVQAGDNTLTITQAGLDNLTLEAEYKRGR